jgi:hypothetical protein
MDCGLRALLELAGPVEEVVPLDVVVWVELPEPDVPEVWAVAEQAIAVISANPKTVKRLACMVMVPERLRARPVRTAPALSLSTDELVWHRRRWCCCRRLRA